VRIRFNARDAAFVADEDALSCAVAGPDASGHEHYLTLQRAPEEGDPGEDWGVYLEFDDQINSGYGHVRRAALSRATLSIDLSHPLGQLETVRGFDVRLECDDATYVAMSAGLPRIFRGMPEGLEIR
jgi:hypothetical protein